MISKISCEMYSDKRYFKATQNVCNIGHVLAALLLGFHPCQGPVLVGCDLS